MPRRPYRRPRASRPPGSLPAARARACSGLAATVVVLGTGLAAVLVPVPGLVLLVVAGGGVGWAWAAAEARWPTGVGPAVLAVPVVLTALVGWGVAGGPAAAFPAGALVVAAVVLRRRPRPGHPVTAPPLPVPAPRAAPVAVADLGALTDAHLCRVWRQSYAEVTVGRGTPALGALVDSRRAVLDEIERRHPAGFAAWLSSGARAAGNPEPYLQQPHR